MGGGLDSSLFLSIDQLTNLGMALRNQKFTTAPRHFLRSGVLIIMAYLSFSFLLSVALAQAPEAGQGLNVTNSAIDALDTTAGAAKITADPKTSPTVAQIVGGVINIALGIFGLFFFTLTIYGGIIWLTAGGNKERADKAVKILTNSSVGVIIIIIAYLVTNYIVFQLIGFVTAPPAS